MGRAWNRAKPDIGFWEVGYSPVKPSCIENSFDNLEVNANAEQEDEEEDDDKPDEAGADPFDVVEGPEDGAEGRQIRGARAPRQPTL